MPDWIVSIDPRNWPQVREQKIFAFKNQKDADKIKDGDGLFFYVKGSNAIQGYYRVIGSWERSDTLWPDGETYNFQVNLDQVHLGTAKIDEVKGRLEFIKNKEHWSIYFMGTVANLGNHIPEPDSKILKEALAQNPLLPEERNNIMSLNIEKTEKKAKGNISFDSFDYQRLYNGEIPMPKNIILHGPVGTGKTFLAFRIANMIVKGGSDELSFKDLLSIIENSKLNEDDKLAPNFDDRVKVITFHQSYGYEEFIQGIKAETNNGQIEYKVVDGIFKELCDKANNNRNSKYVLIIDEINRGDVSRVFGEAITLIDETKRKKGTEQRVLLRYKEGGHESYLTVPENLYIIGTMNDTDRSVALLDMALRRRFKFFEVGPNEKVLESWISGISKRESILKFFENLNENIMACKGPDFQIGHAFFYELKGANDQNYLDVMANIMRHSVLPLLQELFYNDMDALYDVVLETRFLEKHTLKGEGNEKAGYSIKDRNSIMEDLKSIFNVS